MEHTVNLNIHYSVCKETWDKILQVYKSMPYWAGDDKDVKWIGKGIDLWASAERSGIQIAGRMPLGRMVPHLKVQIDKVTWLRNWRIRGRV